MKKVVIISSSPRKEGNSEVLCQQFEKGAVEAGHEVEIINLNKYKVGYCLGCEYCRKHDNQCVLKDDAAMIIHKAINADVIVVSTPIYWGSLSAQLKTIIDRFFAREFEIRESKQRKKAYLILTGAVDVDANTIGAISSYKAFIRILRTIDDGGIINGCGAFLKGDVLNHPSYEEAYKAGMQV